MMTLDEAWKASYDQYLEETENSIDSAMIELIESQNEVIKGYQTIIEYFELLGEEAALLEDTRVEGEPAEDEKGKGTKPEEKKDYDPKDITSFLMKQLGSKLLDTTSGVTRDLPDYRVEGISRIERISDMKFPKNIIFFIQQVIAWIKRVVVYFIEKIRNVFKALIGRTEEIRELNPDALKLQLSRVKKLETIKGFRPGENGKGEIINAIAVQAGDIKQYNALKLLKEDATVEELEESFKDILKDITVGGDDDKNLGKVKAPIVVTIDISKDMLALKELTQHFYDLYDGAFGSNNENLFSADDLKVILKLFEDTVRQIKNGEVNTVEVGSYAVEVSAIDASRIKENLIRTNTNIENLKTAYQATSGKIKDITKIITHKELLMLNSYGIDKQWLTSATYEQMIEILKTIKPRLKEAEKNEKELKKMQHEYEKLSAQLAKVQSYFVGVANITYTSIYQRRIVDMCNAARYMTQLTTLRLTGLGLYIKELKDIRDLLKALANINNTR